jgi:hypothetical protein
MIPIALAIFVIGAFIWKKCQNPGKQTTGLTPSALPMNANKTIK